MHTFTEMSFARLLEADLLHIENACKSDSQRYQLLQYLRNYLDLKGKKSVIDDDEIFALGCELKSIWPSKHRQELIESIRGGVSTSVAGIFLEGFSERPTKSAGKVTFPTKARYNRLMSSVTGDSIDDVKRDVQQFANEHLKYVEATGDSDLAVRVIRRVCDALLRQPVASRRYSAAGLVQELVQKLLRWEPWNPYLWDLWSQGYLAEDATDAAELVYWEAIRRLSEVGVLRNQLINLLRRQQGRVGEAIELARETIDMFPDDEFATNQLAHMLISQHDMVKKSEGVDFLVTLVARSPDHFVHTNMLGWALVKLVNDKSFGLDFVTQVARRVPRDERLLGRIGNVIRRQRGAQLAAQAFFEESISFFDKPVALRNQLAGVLAERGTPEHRAEAIRILKETMTFSKDQFCRNQLAQLLIASGESDERNAAIQLLRETIADAESNNKYSREMLDALEREVSPPATTAADQETLPLPELEETPIVIASSTASHLPPAEILSLGRFRRLRFRLDHAPTPLRSAAVNELKNTLREDPTFAYAQLLAVRQGIWDEDSTIVPKFPAAFELALERENVRALATLREEHPSFELLILVALSLFGADDFSSSLEESLGEGEFLSGIDHMITVRLLPILASRGRGKPIGETLRGARTQVIAALREVNEATIGGGDWRLVA